MAKRDHIDLMQYVDRELPESEAAEVRAQLESSTDDTAVIEALGQISELTRGHLELASDDIDQSRFESMWQNIERRVTANGQAAEEAVAVPRTRSQPAQSQPGIFASIKRWFGEQRGYLVTGTLAAGAAAAVMYFAVSSGEGQQDGRQAGTRDPIAVTRVNTHSGAQPCLPTPGVPSAPMLSEPAAVEELNVTDGTGYILTIPGDDGENDTTVIWIEPEDKLESPI